jgi:hypothetical protein
MNSIIMNFDDGVDVDATFAKLKKQYPKAKIAKTDNRAILAMEELQESMAGEAERLGFQSEEDAMKWFDEAREELWRERHK